MKEGCSGAICEEVPEAQDDGVVCGGEGTGRSDDQEQLDYGKSQQASFIHISVHLNSRYCLFRFKQWPFSVQTIARSLFWNIRADIVFVDNNMSAIPHA